MTTEPNVGQEGYSRALRQSAIQTLKKAKALEAKAKKSGCKYVKSGGKTWKLVSNGSANTKGADQENNG